MKLDLELMQYKDELKLVKREGKSYIYCIVRKKLLVYAPEELVRQLVLLYLVEKQGYALKYIAVERGVEINGLKRRFDILVYGEDFKPGLIIECKAASVALNQAVFDQVAHYNMALKVPYLMIVNGPLAYVAGLDYKSKSYTFEGDVPKFSLLTSGDSLD